LNSPLYGKLGKKVKDLFKKKFDFDNKIVTKHKTKAGLTMEAGGVVACSIAGFLKGKYKDKKFGEAEVEANTCGKFVGSAKLDQLAKNLEVNVSGGWDPAAKKKGFNDKLVAEYAQEMVAASGSIDVNSGDTTTAVVEATLTVGFEGFSVGGQVAAEGSQLVQKVSDYNVGAEYTRDNWTLTAITEKKGDVIHGYYHHQINRDYQIGAQFDWAPRAEAAKQRVLTVGTEYQIDVDTSVKAKADTTGAIVTALQHNLQNPSLQVSLAASFNRKSAECLSAGAFGLALTFGDY